VLFNLNATTYYGENINMVGNSSILGDWDFSNSQPLNPGNYSSERPLWYAEVQMPAGETVSYTYVRQEDCGQAEIYETANRTVTVPACGGSRVITDEAWTGPFGTSGGC
jgi:glucoamylase